MAVWEIFRRKPRPPQKVTTGRFEIERNGEVAYLEYTLAGNILELTHTEVPEKLGHMGLASSLAETALNSGAPEPIRFWLIIRVCELPSSCRCCRGRPDCQSTSFAEVRNAAPTQLKPAGGIQ
jgi:predicted GNAT family acetyltransferase